MSEHIEEGPQGWGDGSTGEDFADLVHAQLGGEETGVVIVPFEDPTLPDHVVMGGNVTIGEHTLPYAMFFSGAVEHFHGLRVSGFSVMPTGLDGGAGAYSMGLMMTVGPAEATPAAE